MRSIGVFGGTFDPIHIGHLRTAWELRQKLGLDSVHFVPCRQPPHDKLPQAPVELRLEMLKSAADLDGFKIDERELTRSGPSFTVDTLESFRAEDSARGLCLMTGMDAFRGLESWHRWEDIVDLANIVVARRPGAPLPDAGRIGELIAERQVASPADLSASAAGRILFCDVTQLEISSTQIRQLTAAGECPRFLVPEQVREIIQRSGCYLATRA